MWSFVWNSSTGSSHLGSFQETSELLAVHGLDKCVMCNGTHGCIMQNNGGKPLRNSARLLKEAENCSYLKYSMHETRRRIWLHFNMSVQKKWILLLSRMFCFDMWGQLAWLPKGQLMLHGFKKSQRSCKCHTVQAGYNKILIVSGVALYDVGLINARLDDLLPQQNHVMKIQRNIRDAIDEN